MEKIELNNEASPLANLVRTKECKIATLLDGRQQQLWARKTRKAGQHTHENLRLTINTPMRSFEWISVTTTQHIRQSEMLVTTKGTEGK